MGDKAKPCLKPPREKPAMTDEKIIGDDGDRETLCIHGIGHGPHVHTCDGCCAESYPLDERRRAKRMRHK